MKNGVKRVSNNKNPDTRKSRKPDKPGFRKTNNIKMHNSLDNLYTDTYEIMDEGYLKWGTYDSAWIDYKYTYWDIKINGNHLTLTSRNNPDNVIELTKE